MPRALGIRTSIYSASPVSTALRSSDTYGPMGPVYPLVAWDLICWGGVIAGCFEGAWGACTTPEPQTHESSTLKTADPTTPDPKP